MERQVGPDLIRSADGYRERIRTGSIIDGAAAACIGLGAFLAVCGTLILDPGNKAWLTSPDPATALFGWSFFSSSPWSLPPGANPAYGMEIASSVVYSDSVPLFALLFKLLRPLVSVGQYLGLWLLLCFVLQAVFAWQLMGRATHARVARLLGAALFVFMPMFLFRVAGHHALAAHWLLLAGLTLVLTPSRWLRLAAWAALATLAALTEVYLLLGLLPLWMADLVHRAREGTSARVEVSHSSRLVHRAREGTLRAWPLAAELVAVPAAIALSMWVAGYFVVHDGLMAAGFGLYRFNLVSPLNPDGWSYLLPRLPMGPGDYEGFAYLGAGGLLLLVAAAAIGLSQPQLLRTMVPSWPLAAALAGLVAYAASNLIGIGALTLRIPLSAAIEQAANVFRSSGRLVWPAIYALVFGCIVIVLRGLGPRRGVALLAAAVLLQAVDTSAGWLAIRAKLTTPAGPWPTPLRDAFWGDAAGTYRRVRIVPTADGATGWAPIAYFAASNRLPTDAVDFGRVDQDALMRTRAAGEEAVATGQFAPDTLYVLNGGSAGLASLTRDRAADLLAMVDGVRVLAPGWKRLHPDERAPLELTPEQLLPRLPLSGGALSFLPGAAHSGIAALVRGWSKPEPHGVWSDGAVAEIGLLLPATPTGTLDVRVRARGYIPSAIPSQRVVVSIGGQSVAEWRFSRGAPEGWQEVPVEPPQLDPMPGSSERVLRLRLDFPDAISPAELALGTDRRALGIAIAEIEIRAPTAAGTAP